MYPLPFGKFGMHAWVRQDSTSVTWLEDAGPSICLELGVPVPAELVELVAEGEDCPDEHGHRSRRGGGAGDGGHAARPTRQHEKRHLARDLFVSLQRKLTTRLPVPLCGRRLNSDPPAPVQK